jgi:hypothetical protein
MRGERFGLILIFGQFQMASSLSFNANKGKQQAKEKGSYSLATPPYFDEREPS